MTQTYDYKATLANWTRFQGGMFAKDLMHTSEEHYTLSPTGSGGAARSPQAITSEVIGFCLGVASVLKGGTMENPTEEQIAALNAKVATRDQAVEALQAAANALGDAIDGATDEDMGRMITTPWGQEMPLCMLASIASSHIWYHDGQLCYIQTLNGDSDIHWM